MADGHLNFDTKINSKGFSDGVKSLGRGLDGIKGKLLGIGAAMGAAFSGKEMIEAAASVKAAESQFEQTFGTMQASARQAIDTVADRSGILEKRLQGTATSIYSFAKTSGMDSTQALDMMSDALQVAADSAAYYDKSLEETSETLKSYLKGNYANDAALGISSTEYTRNAKAMEMYGKKFTELSKAQKQLTLLQMVKDANALSGAEGQAAREADGWENVTGNLKQAWTDFLAVVGTPVLAGAVAVVKRITAALQSVTSAAKEVSSALSDVFGLTADTAASASNVSEDTGKAAESYSDMAESAEAAQEATDKSLAGFDKINKLSGEDGKTTVNDTPAEQTMSVMTDTAPAEKAMSGFEKKIRDVLGGLKKGFADFKGYFGKNFAGIFSSAFGKIGGEAGKFRSTLGRAFSDIGTLVEPLRSYLSGDFTAYLQTVVATTGDIAAGIFDSFNKVFSDIWDIVLFPFMGLFTTTILPFFTQFATEMWKTAGTLFAGIKEIFDTFWAEAIAPLLTVIMSIVTDIFTDLKAMWDENGAVIFEALREALNGIKDTIINFWEKWLKPVYDTLLSNITTLWKKHLRPLFNNVMGLIADLATAYKNNILPIINWLIDKLAPVITGIGKTVINTVSRAISAVIDVLNGLVTFFRGVFTGDMNRAWEGIKQIFSAVGSFFADAFGAGREAVRKAFSFMGDWAKERLAVLQKPFKDIGSWFGEKFSTAYGSVKSAFTDIGTWFKNKKDSVVNAFKELPADLKAKFSDAWEKIKGIFSIQTVKDFFGSVRDTIADIFGKISELIKAPINTMIDGINSAFGLLNSLSIEIPHLDGSVTTWGFNIPEIPRLAQGMAVPANYGEFLAVLGDNRREPEVVSPVSTMEQAMRRVLSEFGGTGGDINLTIELDGETVWRNTVKHNKEHVDSTGVNEFIY